MIPLSHQCNLLFNVLMLFDDPVADDLRLIGYTLVIFLSTSINFSVGPCEHEIITVCQP